jgi:cytochrome b subunit of formate dehydrogenase
MDTTWLVIVGFILVVMASVIERYCEFGRQARPDIKPGILKSWFRWVLETLWVLMLIAGAAMFLFRWDQIGLILAGVAVVSFWLVLPFVLTPIIRNRLLPHWDEVKSELIPKGYDEKNYWRGDWWMLEDKQKSKKKKSST